MEKKSFSLLGWLYETVPGRACLSVLTAPWLSKAAGALLDTGFSRILIDPFVKNCGVDLSECRIKETRGYSSFNDFFTRRLIPGSRPVDPEPAALTAPCDGALSVYRAQGNAVIPVKQSRYTLAGLLRNSALAKEFENGYVMVYRLAVHNYHRYAFAEGGRVSPSVPIPGVLHTVRPVALHALPVFQENSREYTVIDTKSLGRIVQMEVGAMLVGKIENRRGIVSAARGQEKGRFLYGGSTVIVLIGPDKVQIRPDILKASREGRETPVRLGEKVGTVKSIN